MSSKGGRQSREPPGPPGPPAGPPPGQAAVRVADNGQAALDDRARKVLLPRINKEKVFLEDSEYPGVLFVMPVIKIQHDPSQAAFFIHAGYMPGAGNNAFSMEWFASFDMPEQTPKYACFRTFENLDALIQRFLVHAWDKMGACSDISILCVDANDYDGASYFSRLDLVLPRYKDQLKTDHETVKKWVVELQAWRILHYKQYEAKQEHDNAEVAAGSKRARK